MSFPASSSVIADQTAMHAAITFADADWQVPSPSTFQSLFDILFDWTIIYVAVWGAYRIGTCMTVIAFVIVGNRQRALGNLLHEASHQNLSAQRKVNDWIGQLLLAPALLADLAVYRFQHARHHVWLGDPIRDPDYLPRSPHKHYRWFGAYGYMLRDPSTWIGSLFGHLAGKRLSLSRWLAIILWWTALESVLYLLDGRHFAVLFLTIWVIAKATVFHAITTFREMNDHYGLESGGIFRHTRETPNLGLLSVLLHPHHNGYHLTHHLFPHVPYYHLPRTHARLRQVPFFNRLAIVCDDYVKGPNACVDGWGQAHG
ncbi:fatty acid desaturase [Paraburkholderia aspalathi]|uniref:fatty acid desaturase family protein n=1 Tax=Paraburkholderia aspalathi TaxID=1324617 RepID=UPI0038B9754E